MQKITPHLWFDREAKEACIFYAGLFKNSKINNISTIKDTPSGDCDIVSFNLSGIEFMAISAGPYFKLNPSISFFTQFEAEEEADYIWNKLADGGEILMEYGEYPWADKYGWLKDKYGVSWQLSFQQGNKFVQKITPLLMFTQDMAGRAKEAINDYVSIFPDSKIESIVEYQKGDPDREGLVKHARFSLSGFDLMALESTLNHDFKFNEAISLIVKCDTQEEIDHYWSKLSFVPEAEQCGWLKDKYGVSWQIVPSIMDEMMGNGTDEQKARVTQAFLKMKKFDIELLRKAYGS